jgi:pimeloyl-ACP methyl ester carboxylesterase
VNDLTQSVSVAWRARLLRFGALIAAAALMLSLAGFSSSARAAKSDSTTTIVLVHGAFASPAGWGEVAAALHKDGYQTATPTLGLDSVSNDVAIVRSTLDSIPGDKILVGHSYGGFVITNAASGRSDVRGLVYTAAYVPDSGETINSLSVGYAPGAFLAHLVFAPSFPFVIVDPQFYAEDFAQDLNPKLGAEITAQQRQRAWASSALHPGLPVGAGNPVRVVIDLLQPLIRRARWCGFGAGSAQRPGTGDVRARNRFPLRRLAPSGIHARA